MHVRLNFWQRLALISAAVKLPNWSRMKLLFLPGLALAATSRTFVDDAGVTHTTSGTPTISIGVMDGLSLENMGLSHLQVHGTWGARASAGSNYGTGFAFNNAGSVDHNEAEYNPSNFPADPNTPEEMHMIAQAVDLTPSCSGTYTFCYSEPGEVVAQLDAHGWPDFLVSGAYDALPYENVNYIVDPTLAEAAAARDPPVPIISINSYYMSDDEAVAGLGYIEITKRFEELATFLGATTDIDDHKEALCHEITKFKATAAAAATRGVRAMAIYTPYGPLQGDNADQAYSFIMDMGGDQVMNMLEELGMQIMHAEPTYGPGWEYLTDTAENFAAKYKNDFWLYDVRVTLDFTSEAFATAWPHPAVVAKQYAYWPSTGRVHSYQHALDILRLVGESLSESDRLAEATACTEVADVTATDYRVNGLEPGEYACPKPVDYDWCEAYATPSPVPAPVIPPAPTLKPTPAPDDDDKDDGPTKNDVASAGGGAAAAGVVVGLAAGGVLGVLYGKKTNAAPMEQKAYDTDRV